MSRSPFALIAAIAAAPDGGARARLLHDAARALLADPAAVGLGRRRSSDRRRGRRHASRCGTALACA